MLATQACGTYVFGVVPVVTVPDAVMRTFWLLSPAPPVKAVYVPRAAMPVPP